jgi:transposase
MRGTDTMQESPFTVAKLDDFVPQDHPLRMIQVLVNEALGRLNGLFNIIYAGTGRESIAPEKLMRALLPQVFYSIRSERQLMEQMRYNLLFRGFVGLSLDDGCGTTRSSRRTATACSRTRWSRPSLPKSCAWPTKPMTPPTLLHPAGSARSRRMWHRTTRDVMVAPSMGAPRERRFQSCVAFNFIGGCTIVIDDRRISTAC